MKHNLWDLLVKPSTRRFVKEGQSATNYTFYDFLHGYIYGRWPYLYIGVGTGEHPMAKRLGPTVIRLLKLFSRLAPSNGNRGSLADTYHGKVVPLESATRLVTVVEEIRLPDLEQVIPYKRARDIILQNPDHIAVLECPCRSCRENPCLPLDVCLVVGEPFTSFMIEHHPDRARWISQAQAVDILRAEDERGHVHHAFFKDAMLGRFYAICNCCTCCCGALHAHRNGTPMLAASGYACQADEALCIGCGNCERFCQFDALSTSSGIVEVDQSACMGCGVCVDKCDQRALSLRLEVSKGLPLEICDLMASRGLEE